MNSGIVGLGIHAAAHQDQFLGKRSKFGIDGLGQSEVCHRAAFVDGHFVRIFVDHANHKMRGIFVCWLGGRSAFGHWRNFPWAMHGVATAKFHAP